MIKVVPAPESATFDSKVRQPGLRALARKGKIRPYWTRALDDLMAAYHEICAYSCFRIHPITGARSADHFAPKPKDRDNIYEWSNYRLVCSRLNSSKRDFGDVLDPFEIEDGWFQLELLGYRVKPSPALDASKRTQVQDTITRLKLNAPLFYNERIKVAEQYLSGDISLRILEENAPFVAKELRRQGKLLPHDR